MSYFPLFISQYKIEWNWGKFLDFHKRWDMMFYKVWKHLRWKTCHVALNLFWTFLISLCVLGKHSPSCAKIFRHCIYSAVIKLTFPLPDYNTTYMRAFRTTFMVKSNCPLLYASTVTSLTDCEQMGNAYKGNTLNYNKTSKMCEVRSCQSTNLQLTFTQYTEIYVDNSMFPEGRLSCWIWHTQL